MIEIIPDKIDSAFLYFHSAGTNSKEFKPFIRELESKMPNTYIWIGDGNISGSPLMFNNSFYGESDKSIGSCFLCKMRHHRRALLKTRKRWELL